jgi:maltose/moltooligosaccharide transporter
VPPVRSYLEATVRSNTSAEPASAGRTERAIGGEGNGRLTWGQRRSLALLGLPSFGLALAATVVTTYLPVLLADMAGPTVIGALIGLEGLLAIFLPLVIGSWSDRVDTRFGRRMPFLLVATPLAVVALVLMPVLGSLLAIGVLLFCFYVAYFTYYAPYRALYPDLVADDLRGRSQSFQATWREAGLGVALVAGGVLIGIWQPLPFLIAAVVLSAVTVVFFLGVEEPPPDPEDAEEESGLRGTLARVGRLVREQPDLRRLVLANALWESTIAALKTFAVLYITVGLGRSTGFASGVLAFVAVAVLLASVVGGKLADHLGHLRVVRTTLWFYGLGPLLFLFTSSLWVVPAVFVIAFAAGILLALPYSLMMGLMPSGSHGAAAGLYGFSRGAGLVAGPLIAGAAIQLTQPVFESTEGYAAVFGVVAAAVLLSIPLVRRIDADTLEQAAPR